MNELVLELEEIAPKEFFGPQNINIELLKRYFPKLKIVARGNKITAFGDEELLEEFDKRMEMLFSHFSPNVKFLLATILTTFLRHFISIPNDITRFKPSYSFEIVSNILAICSFLESELSL